MRSCLLRLVRVVSFSSQAPGSCLPSILPSLGQIGRRRVLESTPLLRDDNSGCILRRGWP